MTTTQPYRMFPGFTADDWRTVANESAVTLRDAARAEQWCAEAAEDHREDLHTAHDHPFCVDCEQWDWDAGREFTEREKPPQYAEQVTRGRALRYLILHGRPPSSSTSTSVLPRLDAGTLADILARPAEPAARVEGLIPYAASTLISAKRKTGKTTYTLNLGRSLLTGEDFLGRFAVRPVSGTVAILNYEVSAAMLARWADEVGLDRDRLFLVNLRGVSNPLRSALARDELAGMLRRAGTESLIVDTFGRAYTGKSQNDAGEVGAFLTDLEEFARSEVGAVDLIMTAHAGWDGERTRGSTALEDWPDTVITLTSDDAGSRFMRAFGRLEPVSEDRLSFDPLTRTLTLTGTGSRREDAQAEKLAALVPFVVDIVNERPGINGSEVGRQLRADDVPFQKGDELKALRAAVADGLITVQDGRGNAKHYLPAPTSPDLPQTYPNGEIPRSPAPLYRGGGVGEPGTGTSPDLDERPRCPGCRRRMGRAESAAGMCRQCQRITERTGART